MREWELQINIPRHSKSLDIQAVYGLAQFGQFPLAMFLSLDRKFGEIDGDKMQKNRNIRVTDIIKPLFVLALNILGFY